MGELEHTLSSLEDFDLSGTANTTVESSVGNSCLVLRNVAQVGVRFREFHACSNNQSLISQHFSSNEPNITRFVRTADGSSDLTHVLEVSAEVLAPCE